MDPISTAFALAQFVPGILKWITGSDKAEAAACAVIDIAKTVTGQDTGDKALVAIKTDPAALLAFRQAVADREADLDKAYLADRADARKRDTAIIQAGRRNVRADVMVAIAFVAVLAIAALLAMGKIAGDTAAGGFLLSVGGMFARNIGTAFDFEFGSSRSSRDKDEILARK